MSSPHVSCPSTPESLSSLPAVKDQEEITETGRSTSGEDRGWWTLPFSSQLRVGGFSWTKNSRLRSQGVGSHGLLVDRIGEGPLKSSWAGDTFPRACQGSPQTGQPLCITQPYCTVSYSPKLLQLTLPSPKVEAVIGLYYRGAFLGLGHSFPPAW